MDAILLLSSMLVGQCVPGACPPPTYVMRDHSVRHEGLTFLVRGYKNDAGRIVWHPSEYGNKTAWDAAKSMHLRARPATVPRLPPISNGVGNTVGKTLNFGLDPTRMQMATGAEQSAEARRFVSEARSESTTTSKVHVTVIGSSAERANVVRDLRTSPVFASLRRSMLIQDYGRDEWPVVPSLGFVVTGKPSIIVQAACSPDDPIGGKVLYRATDYSIGPEALAEAIRKVSPNYKPSIDPGPANGKPSLGTCPFGFTRDYWPAILVVGVGLVVLGRLPKKGV